MESKSSTMTTTDKLKRLGTDQARNFLNILSDLYDSGIAEDEILEKLSDPYGEGGMLKFHADQYHAVTGLNLFHRASVLTSAITRGRSHRDSIGGRREKTR